MARYVKSPTGRRNYFVLTTNIVLNKILLNKLKLYLYFIINITFIHYINKYYKNLIFSLCHFFQKY